MSQVQHRWAIGVAKDAELPLRYDVDRENQVIDVNSEELITCDTAEAAVAWAAEHLKSVMMVAQRVNVVEVADGIYKRVEDL